MNIILNVLMSLLVVGVAILLTVGLFYGILETLDWSERSFGKYGPVYVLLGAAWLLLAGAMMGNKK